jgi:hypothetical protein
MAGARARAGTAPSNYRSDGSTIDIFKSWTTNREDLASRVTVAVTALKNACGTGWQFDQSDPHRGRCVGGA